MKINFKSATADIWVRVSVSDINVTLNTLCYFSRRIIASPASIKYKYVHY